MIGGIESLEIIKRSKKFNIDDAIRFIFDFPDYNGNLIDGKCLISLKGEEILTDFGKNNENLIQKNADSLLEKFKEKNGEYLFQYFLSGVDYHNLYEKDLNRYKKFFLFNKEFNECKKVYKTEMINEINYGPGIYGGDFYIPKILSDALNNEICRILRESEDKLREKRGLPKVGEGWISESELFNKIKDAFPKEVVIQHGRPSWLDQQHLDVFFSK